MLSNPLSEKEKSHLPSLIFLSVNMIKQPDGFDLRRAGLFMRCNLIRADLLKLDCF